MPHDRPDINLPPEASSPPPVVESSLPTVDVVPIPGSIELDALTQLHREQQPGKQVQFKTEECTGTEEKRTGPQVKGPMIDVALIACGMSSTLLLAQNGKSREPFDNASPLFRSLPLNVKYGVGIKDSSTSFACAHGDNVACHGNLVTIVDDLKLGKLDKNDYRATGMELTMPCLRETVMNVTIQAVSFLLRLPHQATRLCLFKFNSWISQNRRLLSQKCRLCMPRVPLRQVVLECC